MRVLASADSETRPSNALARVRSIPVPVIVKLAEKRLSLKQILALGPGAILPFEKSSEDLFDLYVNNRLYGRGEAMRVGKKFGIRICEVCLTGQCFVTA